MEAPCGASVTLVEELIHRVEERGLKFDLGRTGRLVLKGDRSQLTPALKVAIDAMREEILEALGIVEAPVEETPSPAPIEEPQVEEQPASKKKIAVPAHATLVMIDRTAHACGWEQCHLWCWVGADRWYYASESEPDGTTGHSFSDARWRGPGEQASGGSFGGIA